MSMGHAIMGAVVSLDYNRSSTTILLEPFALYLPAQLAGYPLHEPQVALSETGIRFVTRAAQRAVWTLIGEHNRHRRVGAYVCLAGHPQILRQILTLGVGHHVREPAIEHPLAVGFIEREAFPYSPTEGLRVPPPARGRSAGPRRTP